jgi:hypothetical protein
MPLAALVLNSREEDRPSCGTKPLPLLHGAANTLLRGSNGC